MVHAELVLEVWRARRGNDKLVFNIQQDKSGLLPLAMNVGSEAVRVHVGRFGSGEFGAVFQRIVPSHFSRI